MKGFAAIYRKELYSLFASPIFYVVAVVFLLISGYFLYSAVAYYNILSFQASQNPMALKQLNTTDMVIRPFLMDVSIVLLLISPLLTMRLYAEERKSGTIELLFTYPVSDLSTLLAKFLAVLSAFLIILAGTLPGMFLLGYVGDPNWKALLCGYLGVALLGGAFLALGLFISTLTENQIVAVILTFGVSLVLWLINVFASSASGVARNVINYLSVIGHLDDFIKGVIDTSHIVYYVTFAFVGLFLAFRSLESMRWKG